LFGPFFFSPRAAFPKDGGKHGETFQVLMAITDYMDHLKFKTLLIANEGGCCISSIMGKS